MRAVIVELSNELILSALCFPEGSKIIRCQMPIEHTHSGRIELVIEHESLPDVPEGKQLTTTTPQWRLITKSHTVFEDWGLS